MTLAERTAELEGVVTNVEVMEKELSETRKTVTCLEGDTRYTTAVIMHFLEFSCTIKT